MKMISLFAILIFLSCKNENSQNKTDIDDTFKSINYTSDPIVIDGKTSEAAWSRISWQNIDNVWLGNPMEEGDFSGRFKLLWNEEAIYVLAEIVDDTLIDIYKDGLTQYWDDDCLEIFIDENNSKGIHQYNHNAFAYHISLEGVVADIGTDSLPGYYPHLEIKRITEGNLSTWEVKMSVYDDTYIDDGQNSPIKLTKGKEVGFAIAYCDNDRSELRENFIGSEKVEGLDKNRGWIDAGVFGNYVLIKN